MDNETREVRAPGAEGPLPRIFLFINGGSGDWLQGAALSEDGEFLAHHVSSHRAWSLHDMGLTSDWKHDIYNDRYPRGFVLEWVDDPRNHAGLLAAHALHVSHGEDGSPWQRARA